MPAEKIKPERLPTDYLELVRMYPLHAIRDEAALDEAHEVMVALTRLPELTEGQQQYLDALVTLMEAYEKETETWAHEENQPGPLEVLKVLMDEHDVSAADLGRLLGEDEQFGRQILSGERELSQSHIRTLAERFNLEPGVFI